MDLGKVSSWLEGRVTGTWAFSTSFSSRAGDYISLSVGPLVRRSVGRSLIARSARLMAIGLVLIFAK